MPQFDFYSFSTQVFWVCVLFFSFYFIFTLIFLPEISKTLKLREKRKVKVEFLSGAKTFSMLLPFLI